MGLGHYIVLSLFHVLTNNIFLLKQGRFECHFEFNFIAFLQKITSMIWHLDLYMHLTNRWSQPGEWAIETHRKGISRPEMTWILSKFVGPNEICEHAYRS